jgi:hypothetical protein
VLSQKIVIATAVLFNIARMWKDDGPDIDEDTDSDDGDEDAVNVRPEPVIVQEGDPGSVRVRGQVERDRMRNNMK